LAFFPYSPLFQGLLTDSFKASGNFDKNDVRSANPKLVGATFKPYFEISEKLRSFAREIGKPLSQVAINWLIKQEAVTSVICGAQTVQHAEENVGSVTWELTAEMMEHIENILSPYKEANLL
jgi:aryl-alcohol dehydrogenase-like predicted oxidoreductase